MFGAIALLIAKVNGESTLYQSKVEDLDKRLRAKNIPHEMQKKVFEYFNYCWKKRKMYQSTGDFSDLSFPLQRDLLFHQHKELILNVPLFKELEPMEVLYIIQKLRFVIVSVAVS